MRPVEEKPLFWVGSSKKDLMALLLEEEQARDRHADGGYGDRPRQTQGCRDVRKGVER